MVIDFHTHVLPGIDDGSASLDESLEMLRMEMLQGIKTVVATPHFYAHHDEPDRFIERRAMAEERLRQAMGGIEGMPAFDGNAPGNKGWHLVKVTENGVGALKLFWQLGTTVVIR